MAYNARRTATNGNNRLRGIPQREHAEPIDANNRQQPQATYDPEGGHSRGSHGGRHSGSQITRNQRSHQRDDIFGKRSLSYADMMKFPEYLNETYRRQPRERKDSEGYITPMRSGPPPRQSKADGRRQQRDDMRNPFEPLEHMDTQL